MLAVELFSPDDIAAGLAERARALRLARNLTQGELAKRSDVSLGSLKRFEQTGQISLDGLIRIALVLEGGEQLARVFEPPEFNSMKELLSARKKRQRASSR
jgi:transcriptional regulator with XRE-family HTH domain